MITRPLELKGTGLELLVLCCKHNFRRPVHEHLSLASIQWAELKRLAAFHRVEGLAWNALVPTAGTSQPNGAEFFLDAARTIATRNLGSARESKELCANFGASNIPILFLKGLTVGALAYRDPLLKSAIDIDILIDPADLESAAELLLAAGYRPVLPHRIGLRAWHEVAKESVWTKNGQSVQLDLHTRTADNQRLIPHIDVHSRRQEVRVADGIDLPTLGSGELLAYLAVHGASSAWFRLKWVADFAGVLCNYSAVELERAYDRSLELGAGRAAGQAFLVADDLFGSLSACPQLRSKLIADDAIRRLADIALRLLVRESAEPTASLLGTSLIHWAQLSLLPGPPFTLSELLRQARSAVLGRWDGIFPQRPRGSSD